MTSLAPTLLLILSILALISREPGFISAIPVISRPFSPNDDRSSLSRLHSFHKQGSSNDHGHLMGHTQWNYDEASTIYPMTITSQYQDATQPEDMMPISVTRTFLKRTTDASQTLHKLLNDDYHHGPVNPRPSLSHAEKDTAKQWLESSKELQKNLKDLKTMFKVDMGAVTNLHFISSLNQKELKKDKIEFLTIRYLQDALVKLIPSLVGVSKAYRTISIPKNHAILDIRKLAEHIKAIEKVPLTVIEPNFLISSAFDKADDADKLILEANWMAHLLEVVSMMTWTKGACHFPSFLKDYPRAPTVANSLESLDQMIQLEKKKRSINARTGQQKYLNNVDDVNKWMKAIGPLNGRGQFCPSDALSGLLEKGDLIIRMIKESAKKLTGIVRAMISGGSEWNDLVKKSIRPPRS
ncbi:hypothetical protein BJ684DRAFT_15682 [Piptocephalis cylindrospora]|uniref:Uncharacterized protein n=1 Tax=Piptocephalis cylindrospora TaxID=1907219 RepID=A0A4P9Y569_9FUNG|nr:hypothetical protein BJ684DRAFT_15682 [Piptocephalis cylindrospora]|eukprot:RKP13964.1 hypothetical protein BJ684DRAFT_15682 [Piptocephalis cylindrospora]